MRKPETKRIRLETARERDIRHVAFMSRSGGIGPWAGCDAVGNLAHPPGVRNRLGGNIMSSRHRTRPIDVRCYNSAACHRDFSMPEATSYLLISPWRNEADFM